MAASEPRRRRFPRWALFLASALVVIAVGLVGVLGVLLNQANKDKEDLQASVEANTAEIARLKGQLDAGADREAGLEGRLTTAEGDLAGAQGELADAQVGLEELDGVRDGVVDFFAMSLTVGVGLEENDANCVAQAMADEIGVSELLAGTLASADAALSSDLMNSDLMEFGLVMFRASEECDVNINGPALGQGTSYGDNPVLDALYDQCADGTLAACDALYAQSALGSEYERFGETCGDRYSLADAPIYCAP
jgi:hypothetical protein